LFFFCWAWPDVPPEEEVGELAWDLLEGFLCKFELVVLELAERHELHDVSGHVLLVLVRVERVGIGIKHIHG